MEEATAKARCIFEDAERLASLTGCNKGDKSAGIEI
jgi:hypothetical protein